MHVSLLLASPKIKYEPLLTHNRGILPFPDWLAKHLQMRWSIWTPGQACRCLNVIALAASVTLLVSSVSGSVHVILLTCELNEDANVSPLHPN